MVPPNARTTFERCRLDHSEATKNAEILLLHRDLLHLRRDDLVIAVPESVVDGAVLGPEAFVVRFFGPSGHDRLLLVNLGTGLSLVPNPEPLLAPPARGDWGEPWAGAEWSCGPRRPKPGWNSTVTPPSRSSASSTASPGGATTSTARSSRSASCSPTATTWSTSRTGSWPATATSSSSSGRRYISAI